MDGHESQFFKRCSSCKAGISYRSRYYVCSVSSCQKKYHTHVFCCVTCWDIHNSVMSHKNAGAEEQFAPARESVLPQEEGKRRRLVSASPSGESESSSSSSSLSNPKDVLIVVSKLKAFIKSDSGFNTSADVMDRLSDIVRLYARRASAHARADGRKTVMARDFID